MVFRSRVGHEVLTACRGHDHLIRAHLPMSVFRGAGCRGSTCQFEACVPTGSAAMRGWPQVVRGQARSGYEPGNDGVRVPHVAGPELVTPPHGRRHGGGQVEQTAGDPRVVGELLGAPDRGPEIRDGSAGPAADLVRTIGATSVARSCGAERARRSDANRGPVQVAVDRFDRGQPGESPHNARASLSALTGSPACRRRNASTPRGFAPSSDTARPSARTSSGPRTENSITSPPRPYVEP